MLKLWASRKKLMVSLCIRGEIVFILKIKDKYMEQRLLIVFLEYFLLMSLKKASMIFMDQAKRDAFEQEKNLF